MTREETKKLIGKVFEAFPAFRKNNLDELKQLVDLWHDTLKDTSYGDAYAKLIKYMKTDTSGYAPTVTKLVNKQPEVYGFKGRIYSHEFFEEIERENERGFR